MVRNVRWPQALAWRVRQQLLADVLPDVVEVARAVAGVQAQVTSSSEQGIWLRSGLPPAVARDALWKQRSMVKTWAMRGTLHWLPADEYPMWVAALRDKERNLKRGAAWERYHGMSEAQLLLITDAVGHVIGKAPMTREELAVAAGEASGDPALAGAVRASFGGTVLKTAAAEGLLCFGPDRGRNVTFVDPKAWLEGEWHEPAAGDAKAAVVSRFLRAYGPATTADLARWWGVPPADGKRLLKLVAGEVEEVDVEGEPGYMLATEADAMAASAPLRRHVRLLPAFDTYVLAPHSHRPHAWPPGHHDRISRAAGWITPTVLVDGRVVGVWDPVRRGGGVTVEVEALEPLSRPLRAEVERAARGYEVPLGAEISVTWVDRIRAG